MAKTAAVRVEGARRLRDTLIAAGASVDDLKAVHAEIARMLVPHIAARAPRGKTGRLASSVRPSSGKSFAATRTGGARIPYARPIHWGWPARHIGPNRFAWDVTVALRDAWTGKYEDAIDDALDKVKGA